MRFLLFDWVMSPAIFLVRPVFSKDWPHQINRTRLTPIVRRLLKTDQIEIKGTEFGGNQLRVKNRLTFLMGIKCIQPIVGNVFPHLFTCSIVAFETGCWGNNTTLGAHPKIILLRVSLPQLICVPSQLVFVVLFSGDCALRKKLARRHE
jgi:hypothetical protein